MTNAPLGSKGFAGYRLARTHRHRTLRCYKKTHRSNTWTLTIISTGKMGIIGGCGLQSFNIVGKSVCFIGTRLASVSSRTKENLHSIRIGKWYICKELGFKHFPLKHTPSFSGSPGDWQSVTLRGFMEIGHSILYKVLGLYFGLSTITIIYRFKSRSKERRLQTICSAH